MKELLMLLISLVTFSTFAAVDEAYLNTLTQKLASSPKQVIVDILKLSSDNSLSDEQHIKLELILSQAYIRTTAINKAQTIASNVIAKAKSIGSAPLARQGLYRLGVSKIYLGQFQSALEDLTQVHLAFENAGEQLMTARSLVGIANCNAELGHFDNALKHHLKALKIFQNLDDQPRIANLNSNIGAVFYMLNNYEKAISYYQSAIDTAKDLNKPAAMVMYYNNLGEAYTDLNELDLALKAFQTGIAYADKTEEKHRTIIINMYLGKLYLKRKEFDIAAATFDKVLADASQSHMENVQAEALLGKAKALANSSTILAITYAERSLELAQKLKKLVFIRDAHQLLATLHTNQRDFSKALVHNDAYHNKQAKIIEKGRQVELVKLSSDIETEQQNHEIELLKKESSLQQALRQKEKTLYAIYFASSLFLLILSLVWYRRKFHKRLAGDLKDQVAEQISHIKILSEIGREITASLDIEYIASKVYGHNKVLFDANALSIGLYNADKQEINFPFVIENGERMPSFSMPMSENNHSTVKSVSSGQEIIINNTLKSSHKDIGHNMETIAFLPLIVDSRTIGCLTINRLKRGSFDNNQLNMMRTITAYTAIAVDNAVTHESLKDASNTDFLTKLCNRRAFIESAEYQLEVSQRNLSPLSFAIADIDKFKEFNDVYGHEGGDFVLQEVSKLFKTELREQDIVARWGGEEFVFMLPNTDINGAKHVIEKLRAALELRQYNFKNQFFSVTSTFGVTQASSNFDIDTLIDIADAALYDGKRNGRNVVILKEDLAC